MIGETTHLPSFPCGAKRLHQQKSPMDASARVEAWSLERVSSVSPTFRLSVFSCLTSSTSHLNCLLHQKENRWQAHDKLLAWSSSVQLSFSGRRRVASPVVLSLRSFVKLFEPACCRCCGRTDGFGILTDKPVLMSRPSKPTKLFNVAHCVLDATHFVFQNCVVSKILRLFSMSCARASHDHHHLQMGRTKCLRRSAHKPHAIKGVFAQKHTPCISDAHTSTFLSSCIRRLAWYHHSKHPKRLSLSVVPPVAADQLLLFC